MRPATHSDVPRLLELLLDMQRKSKFAPDIDVDVQTARALVFTAITRNGGLHQGGAFVQVVEKDGRVEAFIVGMLDRVYHIGNRLVANDIFLYATDAAPKTAAARLFRAYVKWALGNPKVAKIMASWTDALGEDAQRIEKLYEREGFHRVGAIWERDGG